MKALYHDEALPPITDAKADELAEVFRKLADGLDSSSSSYMRTAQIMHGLMWPTPEFREFLTGWIEEGVLNGHEFEQTDRGYAETIVEVLYTAPAQ
jgi:hypothetical protein